MWCSSSLSSATGESHPASACLPLPPPWTCLKCPGIWQFRLSARLMIETQVAGKYDIFTKPQAPAAKLRPEQWYQLRDIIRWIRPTEDLTHGFSRVCIE